VQNIPVFNPNSPHAEAIFHTFNVALVVSLVIFAIVTGLVGYCLLRFRGRPEAAEPPQIAGNKPLEITWTIIPLLLLVWLFFLSARTMNASDPKPDPEPDLVVIGHQWWWEARYPKSGAVTANEIHIPTGQSLYVRVLASDVIHDFWVPQLGRKMDMIPGWTNYLWIGANQPDTYLGTCSEYCGAQHAWMRLQVMAQTPAEFEAWQQQQLQPAATPADVQGAREFVQLTCVNCHAIRGIPIRAEAAPDLTHFGSRQTIGTGVISNTPTNLARWLANPQAIKPGTLMPNLQLTAAQIDHLVNYLEACK
jgi:cytochrome c oxidase subunit II